MDAKNRLIDYNIKPSVQRMAVMDYLLKHKTHPTADEIYSALYPGIPTLSKTTVYNTLKLLVDNGAALGLDIDEKQTHFDGDISIHGHFRCRQCGKIEDIRINPESLPKPESLSGFLITETNLYFKGICKECNSKKK